VPEPQGSLERLAGQVVGGAAVAGEPGEVGRRLGSTLREGKSRAKRSTVDHKVYDTTSIMATIEKAYGLKPVAHPAGVVPRDRLVRTLAHAVQLGTRKH